MPFEDIQKFAENTDKRFNYKAGNAFMNDAGKIVSKIYSKYENNNLVTELLSDIEDLKGSYEQFVGDLTRIQNWGMVKENGNTFLVMLDIGLAEEVFNQYYKRRI